MHDQRPKGEGSFKNLRWADLTPAQKLEWSNTASRSRQQQQTPEDVQVPKLRLEAIRAQTPFQLDDDMYPFAIDGELLDYTARHVKELKQEWQELTSK